MFKISNDFGNNRRIALFVWDDRYVKVEHIFLLGYFYIYSNSPKTYFIDREMNDMISAVWTDFILFEVFSISIVVVVVVSIDNFMNLDVSYDKPRQIKSDTTHEQRCVQTTSSTICMNYSVQKFCVKAPFLRW